MLESARRDDLVFWLQISDGHPYNERYVKNQPATQLSKLVGAAIPLDVLADGLLGFMCTPAFRYDLLSVACRHNLPRLALRD